MWRHPPRLPALSYEGSGLGAKLDSFFVKTGRPTPRVDNSPPPQANYRIVDCSVAASPYGHPEEQVRI